MQFRFLDQPTACLSDHEWEQCSELFLNHYGVWSSKSSVPGSRVQLTKTRLKSLFCFSPGCRVALLFDMVSLEMDGIPMLVDHAFYVYTQEMVWITQLVVHADYRRRGFGTRLCSMACRVLDKIQFAGLVSSNPFAVKSLEKAMGETVNVTLVEKHASTALTKLSIPYITSDMVEVQYDHERCFKCLCHTKFHVDHSEVDFARESLAHWHLGNLGDGDEYLALVVKYD